VRTRVLLLATAVLLLSTPSAMATRVTLREQSQLVTEARGLTGVLVQNPRGWVELHPSADGRIHVKALKLSTASESSRARRFSRLTRVETATEAGRFVVRVRYPQHQTVRVDFWRFLKGEFDFPGVEVRLSMDVPPGLAVELDAASGDLKTFDLAAPQSLETASGDIEVRGALAPVSVATTSGSVVGSELAWAHVRSVSGDVTLDGVRGPLEVETTSGDIEVRGVTDSLRFATVSGDIRVDRAPRGIRAGTTSGDIHVEGMAAGLVRLRSTSGEVRLGVERGLRGVDVRTISGDIELRLAEGLGCTLTLTSTGGALDSSVPLQIRTVSRHAMSGVVRGGGPPVVLHSASGDIAVTGGGR
jgi:hypothetical protein